MADETPATDSPDEFTDLLRLLIERTVTLSVRVETLRRLLEARGVFSPEAYDAEQARVRVQWGEGAALSDEEFLARARRILGRPETPPEGAS